MSKHNLAIGALALALSLGVAAQRADAQAIAGAEYFIDDDPGEGMATPVGAADGLYDSRTEEIQATVDTSWLSVGSHLLGVRFIQSDGTWSYTRKTWFYVSGKPTLAGAEWFIDTDPGPGEGHPILLPVDGIWDEPDEEIDINDVDIAHLSINSPTDPIGHRAFVRFLDSDGNWGLPRQATFQVAQPVHITAAKWSTEPINPVAQPNAGHPMQAEDGAFDASFEYVVATDVILPARCSTVYVCTKDNLGRWSTWRGNYLDTSGQWQFDPELAYPPDSVLEFCYDQLGNMGGLMGGGLAMTCSCRPNLRRSHTP